MKDNIRLDSWKEIAKYAGISIKTCAKWSKTLGFPVHRVDSNSVRSRVFAFKAEVDQWFRSR